MVKRPRDHRRAGVWIQWPGFQVLWSIQVFLSNLQLVTHCSVAVTHSENCVFRQFHQMTILEHIYTNLDASLLHTRLHTCSTHYCTDTVGNYITAFVDLNIEKVQWKYQVWAFQPHYNLMGSPLYMWSIVDGTTLLWYLTVLSNHLLKVQWYPWI
jgi:hypothetical protein